MSGNQTTPADQPVLPVSSATRSSISANMGGMKDFLGAPAITLTTYLAAMYLGLDWNFRSGLLTATCLIIATSDLMRGSIIKVVTQGLFLQFVCYHFGMGGTLRIWNAVFTSSAVYAIVKRSSSTTETSVAEPPLVNDTRTEGSPLVADEQHVQDSDPSGLRGISIWTVLVHLIPTAILAKDIFAPQHSDNKCIVIPHRIDSIHWQALVHGDLSVAGCNTAAAMTLAESEMRAYTRDIEEEVCSVSCLKQDYAGHWIAYVSMTPPGHPVDGTYCGEAYSYGDCGEGVVRRRDK